MFSPVSLQRTSFMVIFGRTRRGSSGNQERRRTAGSLWRDTWSASASLLRLIMTKSFGIQPYNWQFIMWGSPWDVFHNIRVYVPIHLFLSCFCHNRNHREGSTWLLNGIPSFCLCFNPQTPYPSNTISFLRSSVLPKPPRSADSVLYQSNSVDILLLLCLLRFNSSE